MRQRLLSTAVLALLISPALAGETVADNPAASIAFERHFTTNALDSDHEFGDWYSLLRGSLQHAVPLRLGDLKIGGQFEVSRYDSYGIEDDRGFTLSMETTQRLSERLEIRGTLSWRRFSEGDDLPIGNAFLGMRTLTDTLAGALQLGADLGNGTVLVLEAGNTFEYPHKTRFDHDLIAPSQLEPERNRTMFSAALTRTVGPFAYGLRTTATLVRAEPLGSPPVNLSFAQLALTGEGKMTMEDGTTFAAALGGEWLRDQEGLFEDLRPTLRLTLIKPLRNKVQLKASLAAAYETVDTDDPLASWLQRAELELKAPIMEKLTAAGGLFTEIRENLLFENEERMKGIYGQFSYDVGRKATLVLRVEYSDHFTTVIDTRKRTLDAFVGLTTRI